MKTIMLTQKKRLKLSSKKLEIVKYITDYTILKNGGSIVVGDFSDIKKNID
jgi:hypothetical protein